MHTLPALRADIHWSLGPYHADGSPSWQIYDPLNNHYYRIGLAEFALLSRWDMKNPHAILTHIRTHTLLRLDKTDLDDFLHFLRTHRLTLPTHQQNQQAYTATLFASPFSWTKWIKKSFFYRIDLFQPDAFLTKTLPYLSPLFHPKVGYVILLAALVSAYLTLRELDTFLHSFTYFFTFSQISVFLCFLFITKCLHELGHAYTAKYFGCHVESMGVMLLFLWPVFFTDSTGSWALTQTKPRFMIASAGVIVDMITAILATLVWHCLSPGPAQSTAFFIATAAWILSLTVNLNPFIRFDGYYMLSDAWDIPNLRQVAQALTQWHFHACLLHPAPDLPALPLSPQQHRKVILYGYGAVVFRVILFSGIALYTYARFYKPLGIAFGLLIIYYFFLAPLYQAIITFMQLKRTHRLKKYTYALPCLLLCLLFAFVYPWHTTVYAPSLLTYAQETKIFNQTAGKIVTQSVQEGQSVRKGQVLLTLASPTLTYQRKKNDTALALMQWRLKKERGQTQTMGIDQADLTTLQAKKAQARVLAQKQHALRIIAPHKGIAIAVNPALAAGVWMDKNTYIAHVIMPPKRILHAYINEKDLSHIRIGDHAHFYSAQLQAPLPARVLDIDAVNTAHLPAGYLASSFGGPLAVHAFSAQDQRPFKLVDSVYHIRLMPLMRMQKESPSQTCVGFVKIQGESRSMIARVQRYFAMLFIREATL